MVLEFLKSKICVKKIMICKRTMDQKNCVLFYRKSVVDSVLSFCKKTECVLKV